MPIYEFECGDCGSQFELLVRGSEKPSCPSCGRGKLNKQLSVPAAHTRASDPQCPAREAGACGMSDCSPGSCGLGNFG